ncbi:MAG: diguanylate cyclase, partial [Desulfovibrionaceae bacterium]|nr:diguanylate cyclase [Desulfovibrionaceae bacterium]
SENSLTHQLKVNLKSYVEQKALNTDTRLEHYEKYIEFLTDYIQEMYKSRDELIATGKYIDAPRKTTPKNVFAMQAILESKDIDPKEIHDDMMFLSHLEKVWQPIAKENDGLIDTVYVGTKSGFLPSYDKWSYIAYAPEGENLYYDFKKSEWYRLGMQRDDIIYTHLYNDSQGRGLTITIAKSFKDTNGVRQGVSCADFNLTGLYNEMIKINFGAEAASFAFDPEGKLISPKSEKIDLETLTGLTEEEIKSILKAKNGILEKDKAFYIYAPIKRVGWTLCAKIPRSIVLEEVKAMDNTIMTSILASLGGLAFITLIMTLLTNTLAASITRPMEKLGEDMEVIGQGNLEHRAMIIHNDEVGDIAMQLNGMVDKLKFANTSLKVSEQRAEEMTVLATQDPLTGIGNRAAYDKAIEEITLGLASNLSSFALIMVDLNFLKRINDVYGHEQGNLAIKKLCQIIALVFQDSQLFRIGGDEFVIIAKDVTKEQLQALVAKFNQKLLAQEEDKTLKPWEKVSAAIGYAIYDRDKDSSVEEVFSRADKAMYACKKEMKAQRTD